ncbi:transporter substrate-binding domain-containing protein [Candidatus Halobeggiatoa sp. HSG11]|nr:transporter substrate-binding domain-containing protein [Candidatus Halobeggiatoa sp. HSG11]
MLMKIFCLCMGIIFIFPKSLFGETIITTSRMESDATIPPFRVLKEGYRRIGVTLKFEYLPAERAIKDANQGITDGVLSRIPTLSEKYTNLIRVEPPINEVEGVAITKNLNFLVKGWESLAPYRIITQRGLKFAEIGLQGMKYSEVNTQKQLFDMLNHGRADFLILAKIDALVTMKQNEFQGFKILEPPLVKIQMHHYLHKKNKKLVPHISSSLAEMKSEGLIKKIKEDFIKNGFE